MSNLMQTIVRGNRRNNEANSSSTGSERLVLLQLADQADDEGYCWASIAQLQFACGIKASNTIRTCLKTLEASGEIYVKWSEGDADPDGWKVHRFLLTLGMRPKEIVRALKVKFNCDEHHALELLAGIQKRLAARVWPEMYEDCIHPYLDNLEEGVQILKGGGSNFEGNPSLKPERKKERIKGGSNFEGGGQEATQLSRIKTSPNGHLDLTDPYTWNEFVLSEQASLAGELQFDYELFDDNGDIVTPIYYEPKGLLFRMVMRHLLGNPRRLNGQQKLAWIELVKVTKREPMFARWMIWMAMTNAAGQTVSNYLQWTAVYEHYQLWCQGNFKAQNFIDRLSPTELGNIFKETDTSSPAKEELSYFNDPAYD